MPSVYFIKKRKHFLKILLILLCHQLYGQMLPVVSVDNTSYTGKAMFGYQGWFGHPNDNSPRPDYWHWGDLDQTGTLPLEVEMYPDLREFCPAELYPTAYTLANGSTAPVFSSGNKETVHRHMRWVRDYYCDGVFLQRFISEFGDPVVMEFRDSVTSAVRSGCEQYGRVFGIMYDGVGDAVENIKTDWMHLVDDLRLLESDRYLNHDGLPLVALWGYTFYNEATSSQLISLINWFHHEAPQKYRASIKLGLNDDWYNLDQNWIDAFSRVEVISPWSVGRFSDQDSYNHYLENQLLPGKNWCDSRDILFVPVLFPGFSWHNLMDGGPKNEIPRDGGNFFWLQAHSAIQNNFETMYFAMLDELDESTAFFKVASNAMEAPTQDYWLTLDADGYDLPSDWYLRCAGKATQTLKGNIANSSALGIPTQGIMSIIPNVEACSLELMFPDFLDETMLEVSLDGGLSFPYSFADDLGIYSISNLQKEFLDVCIKHPGGEHLPMGTYCLSLDCIGTTTSDVILSEDCIELYPNPTFGKFIVSGLTQDYTIKIINSSGIVEMTFQGNQDVEIELGDLLAGMYFVEIKNVNKPQLTVQKILKY